MPCMALDHQASDSTCPTTIGTGSLGPPVPEADLSVRVGSLSGGANDAIVKGITSAGAPALRGWTMLAGIDFPSVGCWRLTLDYLRQSLSFVVETYDWTARGTAT